ncbi:hypothetical protein GCM10022222_64470 [Amycolatopsis ultiminotia]|uniref:Uncharacterized protein n=1 Tax=Amycolatopsis ultiminotia TaxID=543629 RepID=A0ABP6XRM7_9PSEU
MGEPAFRRAHFRRHRLGRNRIHRTLLTTNNTSCGNRTRSGSEAARAATAAETKDQRRCPFFGDRCLPFHGCGGGEFPCRSPVRRMADTRPPDNDYRGTGATRDERHK